MLSLVDDVNHDSETVSHNSSVGEMFSSSCSLPETSVWCKLCFSDYPTEDMHKLYDCRCIFCLKCMKQYLNILISEGNITPLTCPDAQCEEQGKILPKELEIILDKNMYGRYTRLKLAKEVELDPHRTWCPQAGCETVCTICIDDVSQRSSVKCPSCALIFCSFCKATWHQSRSCDEVMKKKAKKDQGIPFNCNEDAVIKRCPLCHVPIERDDGCAQMMCKRCKHVFCWYCLASLDDDFLLRHYDKGPCKNKLGHSRASVIWHRTQVIGIFAGFGVLLLVASPFLLLAAPCILCCKCKVCKGCEEEED